METDEIDNDDHDHDDTSMKLQGIAFWKQTHSLDSSQIESEPVE